MEAKIAWVVAATSLAVVAHLLLWWLGLLEWVWRWRRQQRLRRTLRQQGVNGPPPSFVFGNALELKRIVSESSKKKIDSSFSSGSSCGGADYLSADYVPLLFPYLDCWRKQYGPLFTYSTGSIQVLNVSRVDISKEISQYKSLNLGKPFYLQKMFGPLLGHGIMTSSGAPWMHQRRVIAPEFFMDKVKGMVSLMVVAIEPLLEAWLHQIKCAEGTTEIIIDGELRSYSADVISRACFGSNYSQGKEIFSKLKELHKALAKVEKPSLTRGFGMSCLPTKSNREIRRMEQRIRHLILNIARERRNMADSHEKDLLQSILESANSDDLDPDMDESFIVDNCKNIYFAGHETTAASATWCLMLLAANPHWQDRARAEVNQICMGRLPDIDMLKRMKWLTMVIQETLRLYPTTAFVTRGALGDLKLGDLLVPEGITIEVPISNLHRSEEIWGQDVHKFKPERFSRGISGACKIPHAYIPFGLGNRSCVGQNLAMMELKVAISIILSRFTFSLSPRYRHSPVFRLTVEPEFGVPLITKKL